MHTPCYAREKSRGQALLCCYSRRTTAAREGGTTSSGRHPVMFTSRRQVRAARGVMLDTDEQFVMAREVSWVRGLRGLRSARWVQ